MPCVYAVLFNSNKMYIYRVSNSNNNCDDLNKTAINISTVIKSKNKKKYKFLKKKILFYFDNKYVRKIFSKTIIDLELMMNVRIILYIIIHNTYNL